MTDEELRKLKRKDLLEMLVAQEKEIQALREQLESARGDLEDRRLRVDEAGSIAEAALRLNGVFEAAQASADQYLESAAARSRETDQWCEQKRTEAQREADDMVTQARKQAEDLVARAEARSAAMVSQAERETQEFWDVLQRRLEGFYSEYVGLREILSMDRLTGGGKAGDGKPDE